jgi:hypothetical protein
VCIFIRTDQHFSKTDISLHCKDQNFEICAIHLVIITSNLIILSLYRAPSGEVSEFLNATLKCMYNPKSEFIIWADISIKYLNKNNHKKTRNLFTKDTQFVTDCEFCNKN